MGTVWNVGWTRGQCCQPLATALGSGISVPIRDDLNRACIAERIDVLVARRLTSFDLVPVVAPQDVDLDQVESITVAVSDGPHSPLAVAVADRLASAMSAPWEVVTAFRSSAELTDAEVRLKRLAKNYPTASPQAIEARDAAALTERLSPSTLLVLGAAGGSWLQRQFFGPGHRLTVAAPGGTVAVRTAPRRSFHALDDRHEVVVGPHMPAREARRLFDLAAIPVAESGRLIGVVRATGLNDAGSDATVGDIMEPPVSVAASEPLTAVHELTDFLDGGPVPVTNSAGELLGVIHGSPDHPSALGED